MIWEFIRAEWWVPRHHCGYFPWWLIAWLVIANAWIAVSYIRIPRVFTLMRREGVSPFDRKTTFLIGAFILSCGIGHILKDCLAFVWAHYIVFAAWATMTAVISHIAAGRVGDFVKMALESKRETDRLKSDNAGLVSDNEDLTREIAEARSVIEQLRRERDGS